MHLVSLVPCGNVIMRFGIQHIMLYGRFNANALTAVELAGILSFSERTTQGRGDKQWALVPSIA